MTAFTLGGFIIGAPKAGTSAATVGLDNHPLIGCQTLREMNFFQHDDLYELGWGAAVSRFFETDDTTRTLLGKNVGVLYSEKALTRLREHNPDIETFVFLRNPISRAYSAYHFARRQGWEPCDTFEEALNAPRDRIAGTVENLRNKMQDILREIAHKVCGQDVPEWEPRANTSNEARSAKNQTVARMLTRQFPGRKLLRAILPGRTRDRLRTNIQNINSVRRPPPPLSNETALELRDYFHEHNKRLSALLNVDLDHWNR